MIMNNLEIILQEAKKFFDQKNYIEAIKKFERYIASRPNDYENWFNLGVVHRYNQDIDKEIFCNKKVLLLNSKHRPAIANLGNSYFIKKEVEKALYYWKMLIEIAPA